MEIRNLNYFNCWVSEMISLKMFTFWIFSTLTGSFEVVVINNNLSTTNKWHLFTFPLMFIFSPEVLEILGKCRWNMGNYHHRNWIGKSPKMTHIDKNLTTSRLSPVSPSRHWGAARRGWSSPIGQLSGGWAGGWSGGDQVGRQVVGIVVSVECIRAPPKTKKKEVLGNP